MRNKALVGGGRGVTGIAAEQFVQQGRSRTPMSEDEERRVRDRRAGHAAAVDRLLGETQQGMSQAHRRNDQGGRPTRIMNGEMTANQQAHPRHGIAVQPQNGRGFRWSVRRGGRFHRITPEKP